MQSIKSTSKQCTKGIGKGCECEAKGVREECRVIKTWAFSSARSVDIWCLKVQLLKGAVPVCCTQHSLKTHQVFLTSFFLWEQKKPNITWNFPGTGLSLFFCYLKKRFLFSLFKNILSWSVWCKGLTKPSDAGKASVLQEWSFPMKSLAWKIDLAYPLGAV